MGLVWGDCGGTKVRLEGTGDRPRYSYRPWGWLLCQWTCGGERVQSLAQRSGVICLQCGKTTQGRVEAVGGQQCRCPSRGEMAPAWTWTWMGQRR